MRTDRAVWGDIHQFVVLKLKEISNESIFSVTNTEAELSIFEHGQVRKTVYFYRLIGRIKNKLWQLML
jgi:hypothetical protein